MLPALPRLSDYDVSPQNGFLPDEIPLDILPDQYYQPWEMVVRNFQSLILAKRLRRIVDALPVLETDLLLATVGPDPAGGLRSEIKQRAQGAAGAFAGA